MATTSSPIDTDQLIRVGKLFKTGYELMGSIWENCETEVIATQAITSCALSFKKHGEAVSWASKNLFTEAPWSGVCNHTGLQRLLDGEYISIGDYEGSRKPPQGTKIENGKPQVLRVSQKLLDYVGSLLQENP